MTNQDEILRKAFANLSEEVVRLRRINLRYRMHMDVLISTPDCRTSQKIRETYGEKVLNESIIHAN